MAVYTEVPDEALENFLTEYDIGEMTALKGIAEGVENSNYLLQTDRGNFILTLYEKRVDPGDLPFFLNLMRHLADRGIACPIPVAGRDGEALRSLCGRPAAIITFLDGICVRRPGADHCAQLGSELARFHAAGADFDMTRSNALGPEGWRPLLETFQDRGEEIEPGLTALIESQLVRMEADWPVNLPTGVVHADLFADNVFFIKGKLTGLIDFYFACTDAFAFDLAICLNAWCFEPDGSYNITKGRALLNAYDRARTLTPAERKALPSLATGAALRFLLTRAHDWIFHDDGALVIPKDPREYSRKLRFHAFITSVGEYGLDGP